MTSNPTQPAQLATHHTRTAKDKNIKSLSQQHDSPAFLFIVSCVHGER